MRFAKLAGALAAAALLCTPVLAEEVVVQNDSLIAGGDGIILPGFVAGESAAAWLTAPCDGDIVAIQIFWRSFFGGEPQTLGDAIRVYQAGTFPTPGPLYINNVSPFQPMELLGPVLSDNYLNEFRYMDEQSSIPIQVPVSEGEVFVVSFTFLDTPPALGPSVVTDADGCQPGKNAVQTSGGSWADLCSFGASGDFFIRAVIDCQEATGACCHATGICDGDVEAGDCALFGDVFYEGMTCGEITCTARGACCIGAGCLQLTTEAQCIVASGTYAGDGTDCDNDVCVPGACCDPATGNCSLIAGFECTAQGGTFLGPGSSCDPNPCPQPVGACCVGTICFGGQTQAQCDSVSGTWMGSQTECDPDPCAGPQPCPGDANCDGQVDFGDINGFVGALVDGIYCDGTGDNADVDGNGSVGFEDINPFVDLLTTNPLPIACP